MGLMLPSPDSPRERARTLIAHKDAIEAEIGAQADILKANSCNMTIPLLRNDLRDVTNDIGKVLEQIYDPSVATSVSSTSAPVEVSSQPSSTEEEKLKPFARVDGVAPNSPAAESGLRREDLIVRFGHLTRSSFIATASLQPLAELVSVSENRELAVQVLREGETLNLKFVPRKGWGGRGMLGYVLLAMCHIVPYDAV
ncbi:hypothetical protein EV401DRAFT_1926230 [Pisolithus croceorrhizus]|nr:hypothetical protein EV401DRAFT_1926230 [Pisolithus croceorrhizus]